MGFWNGNLPSRRAVSAAALAALVPTATAGLARRLERIGRAGGSGTSLAVSTVGQSGFRFALRGNRFDPPASVEKLFTATAALLQFGGGARFETALYATGTLRGTVLHGNLYLRGSGDPTFGSPSFIARRYHGVGTPATALAAALRAAGVRRVTGHLYADASLFDNRPSDPSSHYAPDPYLEGELSALAYNRGETGPFKGPAAPARYAAAALRRDLLAVGVHIKKGIRLGRTPPTARKLAAVRSPTLERLLGLMLPPSDNYIAEMVCKSLGARFGARGSTAAGARVVAGTVAAFAGIHPKVVDCSGLSRADRTTTNQVVTLLLRIAATPALTAIVNALPVAGRSGTLKDRLNGTAAVGRCRAKTGTLLFVSSLAGFCRARGGGRFAFAIFDDGIRIETAHLLQDRLALLLAKGRRSASAGRLRRRSRRQAAGPSRALSPESRRRQRGPS